MRVPFVKTEATGNDFVLVDCRNRPELFDAVAPLVPAVCDRRTGVGADGVLFLLEGDKAPWRMRLLNADGSEAEMCGNGLRCIGCYLRRLGERSEEMRIETLAGPVLLSWRGEEGLRCLFRVDMGEPVLKASLVPTTLGSDTAVEEPLAVPSGVMRFTCVSMGNPHAVAFVDDTASLDLPLLGPAVERHPAFPRRTNVEFARPLGDGRFEVRVWERGAGETKACGSGACAVAVAAALTGRGAPRCEINMPGGRLLVEWKGGGSSVFLTGPAGIVFHGTLDTRYFE